MGFDATNVTIEEQTAAANGPREAVRFAFGKNWQRFLLHLDDERIVGGEILARNAGSR